MNHSQQRKRSTPPPTPRQQWRRQWGECRRFVQLALQYCPESANPERAAQLLPRFVRAARGTREGGK